MKTKNPFITCNMEIVMINLAQSLERWSDRQKNKEALIFGETRLTYGELNARVNRLCHALLDLKIEKGKNVAILAYNEYQFIELFLACARMGVMLVPLNFRLVGPELEYQLNASDSELLILGEEFQEVISKIRGNLKTVKNYIVLGNPGQGSDMVPYSEFLAGKSASQPTLTYSVDLDDEFIMIHTSGTTGRPKGAILTQKNILFTALNQICDWKCTSDDITLTSAPLFHAGGSLILTYPLLHIGGTVVLTKQFNPKLSLRLIEKEKVTIVFAAPAMWSAIQREPDLTKTDLSSLRVCLSGGSSQPAEEMIKFKKDIGVTLTEGYGLSECSSTSTVLRPEVAIEKAGSIGKPMLHNVLQVVNKSGEEVRPGEVGEIVQRDFTVMKGYYKRPDDTAQTIRDGWLHTGDLATVDEDGFIYIKGRSKDMIISGAENIYPVEIETVLIGHPKIADAAVVGIPHEKWGETVRAFVVLKPGQAMTEAEVIDYCKENLASYKKPSSVIFIKELPRNPGGKVQKNILKESYQ